MVDVGFPSGCCEYVLLPLVNKEVVLAYSGRIELGRKTKMNAWRKKAESEKHHVAAEGERSWNLTSRPQPYGDTQINRNGLI